MAIKKPVAIPKIQSTQPKSTFKLMEDRDHVRLRPGMYIPNKDYFIYELADNAVDILVNTPGVSELYDNKLIKVSIDKDGVVSVSDNACGLEVEKAKEEPGHSIAELSMSRLKAGTKFEDGVKSAGLNGVGASCINFLSEYFNVSIFRNNKEYKMEFTNGIISTPLYEVGTAKGKHGTVVVCKEDPEMWQDKDDFNINAINNRMKQLCFLNPELKIQVDIDYDKYDIHEVYHYPQGVKTYVEELLENREAIHDPWFFNKSVVMSEATESSPAKTCELSVSFVYTESYSDTIYAFTNNVANTDNKSSNLTGFKRGIAASMKECFEAEYPKSKIELKAEDAREGIVAVISVKVPDPNYIGQGKDYLNMPKVASIIYGEIKEFCEEQLDKNPNEKDNILNRIIEANKVREAAHKAKEAARKNKTIAGGKVEGLTKCNSKKPFERYIWLVEGDSAGGTAKQARDAEVDAILPVFGKIPNVYDRTLDKVISSDKIKILVKALECGIGEDFDIEKLAYNNVVILTDADPDGEHIRCLYITLFYKYMRSIIQDGHLFIAQPPLYTIRKNPRTKKEEIVYAWSASELSEITSQITCKYEVTRNKGLGEMNFKELKHSTMHKDSRRLVQVTLENVEEAEEILSTCMYDKSISARKKFLLENKPGGDN